MRKIISITLGLALLIGGMWGFAYMVLHSGPVKILFWTIPIGSFALGFAILWDDVTTFLKSDRNNQL